MSNYLFSEGPKAGAELEHGTTASQALPEDSWPTGPRALSKSLALGPKVVQLLVSRGVNVDVLCLKDAVRLGDSEVLDILLSSINPKAKVPTVFDIAKAFDDPDIWSKPEMNSEEPSLQRIINEAGLLHIAALIQADKVARYLIGQGAFVNYVPDGLQGIDGAPLHEALRGCRVGKIPDPIIVQTLLDAGADHTIKDKSGRTALEINESLGAAQTKGTIKKLLLGTPGERPPN